MTHIPTYLPTHLEFRTNDAGSSKNVSGPNRDQAGKATVAVCNDRRARTRPTKGKKMSGTGRKK